MPGIDVSRFQQRDRLGRGRARRHPVRVRSGEPRLGHGLHRHPRQCGPDGYYDANYPEAKDFGIRVGPYHRAFVGGNGPTGSRPTRAPRLALFTASVGDLGGTDLRPALDMETPFADLSPFELRLWARTWLRSVERRLDVKPIIYTNVTSWNALGNPTWFARRGYALWVANWDVTVPQVPAVNWAGTSWRVWQHSSTRRGRRHQGQRRPRLAALRLGRRQRERRPDADRGAKPAACSPA